MTLDAAAFRQMLAFAALDRHVRPLCEECGKLLCGCGCNDCHACADKRTDEAESDDNY